VNKFQDNPLVDAKWPMWYKDLAINFAEAFSEKEVLEDKKSSDPLLFQLMNEIGDEDY
jgi:hypothetical protein